MTESKTTFEDTFKVSDFREHVSRKGLWAGAVLPIIMPDLLGINEDNKLIEIMTPHTPALLKSIDEIIVNAIDHCKGCEKNTASKRVTKIDVTYDNYITVYNNGPGIPLSRDKTTGLYLIECAFSQFLAGTNIEKPTDSIKGGINGLGAKIANVHSLIFTVETVHSKQKYIQVFKNRLTVIEKPIITKTTESDYTRITFLPAFKELGYTTDNYSIEIGQWLQLRMYQVAAYLGDKVGVTYNNKICTTTNSDLLSQLFVDESEAIVSTVCKNQTNGYSLNVSTIIMPPGKKVKRKMAIQNMTIINGVVSTKGSHINYIRKIIKDYIDIKISKLTKSTVDRKDITLRLIVCGCIPGIDWSGQNKDTVQVSNKVLEQYKVSDSFLKQISTLLIENIVVGGQSKTGPKIEHDKYIIARNISRPKLRSQCMLLAAEGDSAITLLRTGLTQKENKKIVNEFSPSFDWIGIISLQGVVINAAKETMSYETSDTSISIRSDKLKNNKRLNMLADAFGLKYEYTYESPEELNTLNYGKLILCTDQDLDGTGKIASLVLVWIHTFWPGLLRAKRIGKLMTPVIRAYKGHTTAVEFHYEQELEQWMHTTQDVNKYRIKYYKGLATHDSAEASDMFKIYNFNKNIYLYTIDDIADELFKIYFGINPLLRKQILITPVKHLTYSESIELKRSQEIPVGKVQLNIDTKLYKNEAISRQLPHAIDGLNPARRKILMASIIRFGSDSKEVKVFQLGGYVADKMLYHHGDASLNKTIVTMAQSFKGAKKYPYLHGIGQFGDRHGSKAGSSRYISVKLNNIVHNIFPSEDRWLLPYTFDEGIRAEPEYFIPILPMTILESYQIVTEGWNHKSYYRTLSTVVNVVKDYISGDGVLSYISNKLHATLNINCIPVYLMDKYPLPTEGDIRRYKDSEYSFGDYKYDPIKNIITITELPIGILTANYIEQITKTCNKYIEKIEDYSSTDEIDINIYLKPKVMDYISSHYGDSVIDAIEECFSIRSSIRPNLNYYSCNKSVLEFQDSYLAAILYWAPVRRDLYKSRLIRKEILTRLLILKEISIIRYIEMSNVLNLSSIEDDISAKQLLKIHEFPGINVSVLNSPGYTDNDVLEQKILIIDEYDYILDLKERELTKSALLKRLNNLEKYKNEYTIISKYLSEKPFAGASLWLSEIDTLIKLI